MGVLDVGTDSRDQRRPPPAGDTATLAARQHGLVTFQQLTALGISKTAISYRMRIGRLHPIHRGVYAVGHPRLSLAARFLAAALASGSDAAVSHVSAAILWGLLTDFGGPTDVTVARRVHSRRGIRLHCVRRLDPADLTVRDGIPLTTVTRTLLDLADTASDAALRRATRLAQVDRLTTEQAIRQQLARSNGRRGAHRLAALISDGPAPTRSELEDRLLDLIRANDLPPPKVNAVLRNATHTFEVDFLFPDQRVVVETDGWRYHGDRISRRRDADKQAVLEASGFRVIRLTWDQVKDQPDQTVRRIGRLLE